MFRARKLTFRDVLIRDEVNVDTEPAEMLITELNKYWAGKEKDTKAIFFSYNGQVDGQIFEIYIDDEFVGNVWLKNNLGGGKFFGWRMNIDRGKNNWIEKECWSKWLTLKKRNP